ncbi:hypothetical protein CALVIDRAFT_547625 [Calocera viscosa TUFC12733]|uniref:Uncharacterized protein n=1 Tax=Calocera viscosa (strain TUFC12733) TaxID=1330018 RepID=A0A167G8J0_CALVF|nr:hypothetical protein CALVIDRAFT_547625 [Calocera viscosa TUFC12733]
MKIRRRFPSDPLADLIPLPTHPPPFSPGFRLTQDRFDNMEINKFGFLWPEEERLVAWILHVHEMAFSWEEVEIGRFRNDYFDPVVFPIIEHTPWQEKNIPIPPALIDTVIQTIREKIKAGAYEPAQSAYRSSWFVVLKKNEFFGSANNGALD